MSLGGDCYPGQSCETQCLLELKKASSRTLQLAECSQGALTSEILTAALLLLSALTFYVLTSLLSYGHPEIYTLTTWGIRNQNADYYFYNSP